MREPGEPMFYGRRHGHRLRAGRQALLQERLPAYEIRLPGADGLLDPASLFEALPAESRFHLEIGFGNGEHLVAQARARPEVGFLGCEPFINGVSRCLGHIEAEGVRNVRLYAEDARRLLILLPRGSLERVSLLFPDPWPKARHHRRRFVQPETLDLLARVLAPGGEFRTATDHIELARWMLFHGLRHPAFDWPAEAAADWRRPPADESPSRYEEKAKAAGRACLYLQFRRRDLSGVAKK